MSAELLETALAALSGLGPASWRGLVSAELLAALSGLGSAFPLELWMGFSWASRIEVMWDRFCQCLAKMSLSTFLFLAPLP
jgi:hypothetical protein